MEAAVIALFCLVLVVCNVLGLHVLVGLVVGLVLFWAFAFSLMLVPLWHLAVDVVRAATKKTAVVVTFCVAIVCRLLFKNGTNGQLAGDFAQKYVIIAS